MKVDNSVRQFEGRLNSAFEFQEVVSAEEGELNQKLLNIQEEIERRGLADQAAPYLELFKLRVCASRRELHLAFTPIPIIEHI